MDTHKETGRQRGIREAKKYFENPAFWFVDAIVGTLVGLIFGSQIALLFILAVFVIAYVVALLAAFVKQRNEARQDLFESREKHDHYVRAVEHSKPHIMRKEPGASHIQEVTWFAGQTAAFSVPFIKLRLVNDPETAEPSAKAHQVAAKITFTDRAGKSVLEIDGRWSESEQPSKRDISQSRLDLLRMDFDIGDERSIDIAFHDLQEDSFYAYNNDSYQYPGVKKPQFKLAENTYDVSVRLRAVHVDKTFRLRISRNAGVNNAPAEIAVIDLADDP